MEIKKITVGALQTNCYLVIDGGELAVVDPGDEAQKIADEIEKTGAVCKLIINTHGHFDHIGANRFLKDKYEVPAMAGENEKGDLDFVPDEYLKDGRTLKIGNSTLKIIATPGHTEGGICLFGKEVVFSGDTIFDGNIGRTDLAGGSNVQMAASLKELDGLIPDGATVYPGHGDIFKYKKGMALEWLDYLN